MTQRAEPSLSKASTVALAGAGAAAALAVANTLAARRAEAANPPGGAFVEAEGVRLHVLDLAPTGPTDGPPVVLLHGNVVTGSDWMAAGVAQRLARSRRVLVFDRPGFGHSDRPQGSAWGPEEQAALIAAAAAQIGAERPVVVGHSWGAMVAWAWGLAAPSRTSGVVLLSGYYYPTARADAALVAPAAAPVVGHVLRRTVSPPFARAALPATLRGMFAPQPVPPRFERRYSHGMMARPKQIRAAAQEGTTMVPAARRLSALGPLRCPASLMAGTADHVVDPDDQTVRLARETPGGRLRLAEGVGHMVHHAAPGAVADLVRTASPAALAAPA